MSLNISIILYWELPLRFQVPCNTYNPLLTAAKILFSLLNCKVTILFTSKFLKVWKEVIKGTPVLRDLIILPLFCKPAYMEVPIEVIDIIEVSALCIIIGFSIVGATETLNILESAESGCLVPKITKFSKPVILIMPLSILDTDLSKLVPSNEYKLPLNSLEDILYVPK
jgi:hypothetical protein